MKATLKETVEEMKVSVNNTVEELKASVESQMSQAVETVKKLKGVDTVLCFSVVRKVAYILTRQQATIHCFLSHNFKGFFS